MLSETDRIQAMRPIRKLSELNFDQLDDLIMSASRKESGAVQIFVVADFVAKMPLEARTKFFEACEEKLGRKISKPDIESCLKNEFAIRAIKELLQSLERSKVDGLISRSDLVPELDFSVPFTVSPAVDGPQNPAGEWGDSGLLTIRNASGDQQ